MQGSREWLTRSDRHRVLFEGTAEEKTIYLGPWEVVGNEQRRVLWQCSYQLELLEHFCKFKQLIQKVPI